MVDVHGNPISGFRVRAGGRDLAVELSAIASTAADGSFELSASGTDVEVESDDEGWVFACEGWMEMRTIRVFVAAPAIDVSGTIVDRNAAPIPGAHAEFGATWDSLEDFPLTLEGSDGSKGWMAISEPDGRFHLPRIPAIPGGSIRGSKTGYGMSSVAEPDHTVDDLRIVLALQETGNRPHVRGIVIDDQGARVPGATVRLGQDESTTDASGSFDIEVTAGLGDGTPLTAMKRNMQAAVIERFDEQFSGEPEGVEGVVLRLGGEALSISGTILDTEGKPCLGWKVDLEDGTPSGRSIINLEAATTGRENMKHVPQTDAEGRFRIGGLRDRTYRIQAWSTETCLVLVSEPVAAGSIGVELRLSPDAVRPFLRGTVVSKRGLPVPMAEVSVARVSSRSPDGGYSFERCRSVRTDASGGFELSGVPRRNVFLSTEGSMFGLVQLEIPADASGDDVRIEVDVQCRFRLEPRPDDAVDRCVLLDAQGRVVRVTTNRPDSSSIDNELRRGKNGFPVCVVSEEAVLLVLYEGERELRRVPLDLHPGDLQIVVP